MYNATVHCCWKQNSLINNMGNDFCLVVKLFRCNFVYVVVRFLNKCFHVRKFPPNVRISND